MRWFSLGLLLIFSNASQIAALELRGPKLAAASNFGQGFVEDLLSKALEVPVNDFRDAVYWDQVETAGGRFLFETPQTRYPDLLAKAGATMSLTVNNGHHSHESGNTPTSTSAVQAFGRHAAETVLRFPAINAVEVGNEFNSANFVFGPLKDAGIDARAEAYAALLQSVWAQVKAVRPNVRVIGGGVHSIPTGYLSRLIALGAVDFMDTIALHPYDTPTEQIARQIAVMRRLPELAEIPVEITEFGSQSPKAAPGYMLRAYCQMALSGVSRAVWYAVNTRGDGYAPLVDKDLGVTNAGRAFAFVRQTLEGLPVRDVAPDRFTYACLFEDRKLVIWGMPRTLTVMNDHVEVFDSTGDPLAGDVFHISETDPLILVTPKPLLLGHDVTLGPQRVLADSYHQFSFPGARADNQEGLERSVRTPDDQIPVQTMPGQDRPGRPWTPYLGVENNGSVLIHADSLLPGGSDDYPAEIVHTFTAPRMMRVDIMAHFAPVARSSDGISVAVRLDTAELAFHRGKDRFDYVATGLEIPQGGVLEFVVGPNRSAAGDVTAYRITLTQSD